MYSTRDIGQTFDFRHYSKPQKEVGTLGSSKINAIMSRNLFQVLRDEICAYREKKYKKRIQMFTEMVHEIVNTETRTDSEDNSGDFVFSEAIDYAKEKTKDKNNVSKQKGNIPFFETYTVKVDNDQNVSLVFDDEKSTEDSSVSHYASALTKERFSSYLKDIIVTLPVENANNKLTVQTETKQKNNDFKDLGSSLKVATPERIRYKRFGTRVTGDRDSLWEATLEGISLSDYIPLCEGSSYNLARKFVKDYMDLKGIECDEYVKLLGARAVARALDELISETKTVRKD